MNWGEFIKQQRTAQGMSRADLSLKSGIKDATIYMIEKGQKQGGSILIIGKLLDALGFELCVTDKEY